MSSPFATPVLIDGTPGVAATVNGRIASIMAFGIGDERIVSLEVLADPDRLATLEVVRALGG